MKLSETQLKQISETLESYDLVYEDIKIELIDHIASQIETLPDNGRTTFDHALKIAFEDWKTGLRTISDGFWVARKVTGPKIVVDRWISYSKKHFFYILILAACITLPVIGFIHLGNMARRLWFFENAIKAMFISNIVLVAISRILVWKQKFKTSAGYLFNRRSLHVFFVPVMIAIGLLPTKILHNNLDIQLTISYFLIAFNLYFMLDYPLVLKHLEINKKLTQA